MDKPFPGFQFGKYVHYKGGEYVALHLAYHHESREIMVVYVSCEKGTINVRPLNTPGQDSWWDLVYNGNNVKVARFHYVGPA
jgi:hypothetical protein